MKLPFKRYGLLASISLIAALMFVSMPLLELAHAQGPMPGSPYIFYGDVTLSGSPSPQNTTVTAQIGSLSWSTAVDANHQYGVSPLLIILGNTAATGEPKNGWANGDVIQFTVGGANAQTYTCSGGGRVLFPLSAGGGGSPPAVPVLSSPLNTATSISITPTLQWGASSGASTYSLLLATNAQFTGPIVNQSGITAIQLALASALGYSTQYYWKVRASNSAGDSDWSTAFSFTTVALSPPAAPVLASPLDTVTGISTTPALQWNSSAGATSYTVQVSISDQFGSTVVNQTTASTQYAVTTALSNNVRYYWRVRAANAGGNSAWSTRSFTTINPSSLAAPVMYAPGNTATGVPIMPLLQWNASTGATSYGIQVSPSISFSTTIVNVTGLTAAQYYIPAALSNSTQYFWRVNAANGTGGLSDWSSPWYFVTIASSGGGSSPGAPALYRGTAYLNSSLALSAPITAYINGSLVGTASADAQGRFGYDQPFFVTGSPGDTITFKVSGVTATETKTLAAGLSTITLYSTGAVGPVISCSASTFSFTAAQDGSNPTSQALTITNSGTGTLSWSATDSATWLTLSSTSGTAPSSVTVSVNITGMSTGTYPTTITISASGAGNSPVTLPVSLYISPPLTGPRIVLGSTSFTFSTTAGVNPSNQTLSVSNGGTGTLSWSATDNATWLTLTPASGTNTGSVALSVNVAGLANGTYTALISVNGASGTVNSPQTATVRLTIGSTPSPCGNDPIGCTAGPSATWGFANRAYFCKYTATSTTDITKINVYFVGAGNAKVAIYNDSSGMVGSLIQTGEGTVTGAGIQSFTIASTPITSGTRYWLAAWSASPIIGFVAATGTIAYRDANSFTFDSSIPRYAGTVNWRGMISGSN